MATIERYEGNLDALKQAVASANDSQLMAQELVQQGALHAISTLLQQGLTEENATNMLASLRAAAHVIREETRRRGKPELFPLDQLAFN